MGRVTARPALQPAFRCLELVTLNSKLMLIEARSGSTSTNCGYILENRSMLPKHRPRSNPYSGEKDRGMRSLIFLSGLACDFVHSRAGCKIHNAFTVLVLQSQWRTRQRSCFACYLLSCVSHDVFGRLDIRLLAE